MIPYTDQFPGATIVVRSSGLARYVSFEMSLEGLNVPLQSHIARAISANLAGSLNTAIAESTSPFVWIVDDDHAFDAFMLLRLMQHNVPVVNGLTCMNKPPFHSVIYKEHIVVKEEQIPADFDERMTAVWNRLTSLIPSGMTLDDFIAEIKTTVRTGFKKPIKKFTNFSWKMLDQQTGLMQVPYCGTAGLLVKREVFEKIPAPWFELGQTNPEEPGEDLFFCEKLTAAGIPIMIDLDLPFGHTAPCSAWPVRLENGAWTIRLTWENGHSIVINRPDLPPIPLTNTTPDALAVQAPNKGQSVMARTRELVESTGATEQEAFEQAMAEARE